VSKPSKLTFFFNRKCHNMCKISNDILYMYKRIHKHPMWTQSIPGSYCFSLSIYYWKHTYKTKDRVTRTSLKTGGERRCSGRVGSSCSTSDTRRVNLVRIPVISHERGKDREVFTTSGAYPWSLVTQIFHSGQPSHLSNSLSE
jgi:hypothetical protein